nr:MAG TPA: hypothetical protein [Caudoviricetes sp.]
MLCREEPRPGGNARRVFFGVSPVSVQLVQRPQRQFLRRAEQQQRVQRQQRRAPALVENRD